MFPRTRAVSVLGNKKHFTPTPPMGFIKPVKMESLRIDENKNDRHVVGKHVCDDAVGVSLHEQLKARTEAAGSERGARVVT